MKSWPWLLWLGIMALGHVSGWAQAPRVGGGSGTSQNTPGKSTKPEIPDSVGLTYYEYLQPWKTRPFADTLLDLGFSAYDPVRKNALGGDWINLGLPGSAHRSQWFIPVETSGITLGDLNHPLYHFNPENREGMILQKPFARFAFNQREGQKNLMTNFDFYRHFARGFQLGLNYSRINQEGIYSHQKHILTNLAVTLSIDKPRRRWHSDLQFILNNFDLDENGGVTDTSEFSRINITQKGAVNINLESPSTTHRDFQTVFNFFYHLNPADTGGIKQQHTPLARLVAAYQDNSYDYLDPAPGSDSVFYGAYWTSDTVSAFLGQSNAYLDLAWIDLYRDTSFTHIAHVWSLGARLQNIRLSDDTLNKNYQQIRLYSDLEQNISTFLRLEGHAHYILGTKTNDLFLKGALKVRAGKHELKAYTQFNRFSAPWIYQRFSVKKNYLWQNNFDRSTHWTTGGTLNIGRGNLVLDGRYSLLGNWLYFDSLAIARQTKKTGHLVQFKIYKNFRFGPFATYHEVGWQETGLNELPLPTWTTHQAISGEFYLFRKRALHTRIVLDLRWNSAYYAPGFFPVSQQFHLQNRIKSGNYPLMDLTVNFRVSTWRAFLKYENLSDFFMKPVYFNHVIYPYLDGGLRVGLVWLLRD